MRRALRTRITTLAAAGALLGAVTACADEGGATEPGGTETAMTEDASESPMDEMSESPMDEMSESPTDDMAGEAMGAVLGTAATDLGEIVVDGEGRTVYYYSADEPGSGESACEGECLTAWPPVHAGSDMPEVEGVTAEVGTITGNDGELQVTLGGRPLYLYSGDMGPGETNGQGVDEAWWVVAPDGAEIME